MKKILLALLVLMSFNSVMAQGDVIGKRVIANQAFYMKDYWITGIQRNSLLISFSDSAKVPTAKAVADYVNRSDSNMTLNKVLRNGNITDYDIIINPGLGHSLDLSGSAVVFNQLSGSRVGTLSTLSQSGNHTWSLPDATGTIALTSNIPVAWLPVGNSGVSGGWLGTNDANPLVFHANGLSVGNFGIGGIFTTNYNAYINGVSIGRPTGEGTNAMFGGLPFQWTTGFQATTIGIIAGQYGKSGNYMTAVGYAALRYDSTASGMVGIGAYAGTYSNLANAIFFNSINRSNAANDTTKSVAVFFQDAVATNQRVRFNAFPQFVNGTEGINKILVSDASGIGAWGTPFISGSFSGVGVATTVFTVTIGSTQSGTSYKVNVTPTSALSAAVFYVTNKTTTTFDVTYLAGLTGTVTFDWSLFQ